MINLYGNASFVGMNLTTYNSLPSDVQKVFDDLSCSSTCEMIGKLWDDGCERTMTWLRDDRAQDNEIVYLSEEETKRFDESRVTFMEQWAKDNEANIPAKEIVELGLKHKG